MNAAEIDGALVIDKPAGWTSHDVVAKMRGILKTRRIGHTGTLDPFATGVLVICVNRATRLVQFLTGHEKEYLATIRLGWRTETGDLTGGVVGDSVDPRHLTRAEVEAALGRFRGRISQIPPMYSAKKLAGKRLYELAREGKEVARNPVEVEITGLDLLSLRSSDDQPPALDLEVRVSCSAGTYIRTLAEDIGNQLGVGGHLTELRRIRAGKCRIEESLTLDELADTVRSGRLEAIVKAPADALDLPVQSISEAETTLIIHGRPLPCPPADEAGWSPGELIALCDPSGKLIAVARYDAVRRTLAPCVVLAS